MRVVLATTNEHKVHELRAILSGLVGELGLEIVSTADFDGLPDVAETEVTFVGNATLKARAIAAATGLPALADDSGLTVDVLGGAPGVFSARWSGSSAGPDAPRATKDRANLALLLEQLADVPDEHRGAAFTCAAVIVLPDGTSAYRIGRCAACWRASPRAATGSATTRSLFPTTSRQARGATSPSTPTRRRMRSATAVVPSVPLSR